VAFGKSRKDEKKEEASGLFLVKDGVKREVTFQELALSNTLSLEALVRVLARSGNINPDELLKEMEKVKSERFRDDSTPPDDVAH